MLWYFFHWSWRKPLLTGFQTHFWYTAFPIEFYSWTENTLVMYHHKTWQITGNRLLLFLPTFWNSFSQPLKKGELVFILNYVLLCIINIIQRFLVLNKLHAKNKLYRIKLLFLCFFDPFENVWNTSPILPGSTHTLGQNQCSMWSNNFYIVSILFVQPWLWKQGFWQHCLPLNRTYLGYETVLQNK
jgi:hypothetical protein